MRLSSPPPSPFHLLQQLQTMKQERSATFRRDHPATMESVLSTNQRACQGEINTG
ncbi:unnamed protein product, partial [Candidula unifasciata]